MNTSNNIFYTAQQRTSEYAKGQYIGAIDHLIEAEKTTGEIRDIRVAVIDHYRTTTPKLLEGLDRISSELGGISASISQISENTADILKEVELTNRNLMQIEATLDAGFELIRVRLDIGNRLLTDIVKILSSPIATQAAEYLSRATGYLRDGFYEEAEIDLRKVTELDQGNYCAWYLIGLIRCQSAGDRDGAHAAFEKCNRYSSIRSKYYYSRSLFEQALLYHRIDKASEKAISTLLLSIEADANNYQSHFFIAELLAESGKLEEAEKHLGKCVSKDVMYFLRSSQSKSLVDSTLHSRYFTAQTADLLAANRSLALLLKTSSELSDEANHWSCGKIDFGPGLQKFVNMESMTGANDYLAQRELRRTGAVLAAALRKYIGKSDEWLSSQVDAARKKLASDIVEVKQKTDKEIARDQNNVALVTGVLIGGGVAIWLLLEIISAFQKDIFEGIFATILILMFGAIFFGIAAVGWGAISGVLVGFISLFGKMKSEAVQSRTKNDGAKEIAILEASSQMYSKRLLQLKTELDSF